MAMARCRGERRMLAKAWLVGRLPTHVAASIRRSLQSARRHVVTPQRPGEERGRPPARRGRAGGFHWCPGHRGCRVTALATALRRNSCLNCPCPSTAGGSGEMTVASCERRADFAPDHPKASPNRRRGNPCRGVRCVVAAGLPPSRLYGLSGASAVPTTPNGSITRLQPDLRGFGRMRWRVAFVTPAPPPGPKNGRQGARLCGFRAAVTSMTQRTATSDTFKMIEPPGSHRANGEPRAYDA